ncbi:PREDICTED: protein tramtrack, beta isoform-like isoform X4 [Dinoponera quadriceps]|uniref:Protein tramtrack, beta isoform-like isoform X4 n=1 Tax=Dinoponera quadriceps TaxID=609295 RepID=A0A6P3YDM9_DINQU|nr:PREDICTED: protein tramtrack, beta isoform-like isoform X4 [Dinoponera quadriceps]
MGSSQQFSLRWNNYLKHITCAFDTLRTDEDLVDVTLSCEGKRIRAHKMLLSACSTYFRDLFKENPCQHPIIIFRNVKFDDLAALVDFMYQGEVNVVQEQLASFLTTAELLAVQGLTDGTGKDNDSLEDDIEIPNEPEVQLQNTSGKSSGENKRNKSPSSPIPFHSVELQPEIHPNKRRKTRDTNASAEKNSAGSNVSGKDADSKTSDSQSRPGSDPVEIIPLMPNLKLEMPEYLEQDGSSCSYEDQSLGDNPLNKNTIDDTSSTPDHEQKLDISQTFYSSQSTSDGLDGKHQSSDVGMSCLLGHLLSKPSTSGERLAPEIVQVSVAKQIQPSTECDRIFMSTLPSSNVAAENDTLDTFMKSSEIFDVSSILPAVLFSDDISNRATIQSENAEERLVDNLHDIRQPDLSNCEKLLLNTPEEDEDSFPLPKFSNIIQPLLLGTVATNQEQKHLSDQMKSELVHHIRVHLFVVLA